MVGIFWNEKWIYNDLDPSMEIYTNKEKAKKVFLGNGKRLKFLLNKFFFVAEIERMKSTRWKVEH